MYIYMYTYIHTYIYEYVANDYRIVAMCSWYTIHIFKMYIYNSIHITIFITGTGTSNFSEDSSLTSE